MYNGYELIYKPPQSNEEPKVFDAKVGYKFARDMVLLESFLIKQGIPYKVEDLEETPYGLGYVIRRD